jgi:hypothetical protein
MSAMGLDRPPRWINLQCRRSGRIIRIRFHMVSYSLRLFAYRK